MVFYRVNITGISRKQTAKTREIKKVKLGVYKSWRASADAGWTRYILENYEFPYKNIHDAEIRAGNLKSNYDVIIMPSSRPDTILNGHSKGTMPPKYIGGITTAGVRNLRKFAEDGGTIVFLSNSCNFALDYFNIPVKNILKNIKKEDFVCNGSMLRMVFDNSHPVAYGMPEEASTVFNLSCVFEIQPSFKNIKNPVSIAKYPDENPLMSGWIHGDQIIRQKSGIVAAPFGKGNLILLGFPVQFRAQPYGTFKLLFNSIFYLP